VNANSAHLDLEDLIAEATGQATRDQAREHLAGCRECQLEANRWNLIAGGIRDLAAEPARAPERARPPRAGRRLPAGPWRRAVLVAGSAAAALVLLVAVGIAAGLVHVQLSGSGGAETTLTSVSGCAALEQASGTLEQVNAGSLVIKTASGQPLTVTTKAATKVAETGASGTLLGDITDGASVTVRGPDSGGTIAAFFVIIANPAQQHPQPPPGMAVVEGTVSGASASGFTVVTSGGTRVPVTTSSDTVVSVPNASLGQLLAGATIVALGNAGPDGTLSAKAVAAILPLPATYPQVHVEVHVKNCSPASIDNALAFRG
jgi:hypothetical protein